jgi:Na+-driven multidrug efflux pump
MQLAMSLTGILQNATILKYGGEEALTAMTISFSVFIVIIMPLMGISQGAQPIIGYNYGARQYDRVKKCWKLAFLACTGVLTFGFLAAQLIPEFCFSLFSDDTGSLRELCALTMRITSAVLFIIGLPMTSGQLFQAIGKPVQAAILGLSRQIIFLIPMFLLLPLLFIELGWRPIYGVYSAFPISDICAAIIAGILVRRQFKAWRVSQ